MMKNSLILLFLISLLSSCGKSTKEKTQSAVLSANISLSKGNCQEAIDVLEANGRDERDAQYLKTLASGYACRAGFKVTTFFTSDLGKTSTPAPFGGATLYSTSQVAVSGSLQNDSVFKDMQTAIDLLYYAGGFSAATEPTSIERAKYFTGNEAADINSQMVFMMLAQLGKYMEVYSNAGTTGVKGSGSASNKCFTDYGHITNNNVKTALANMPGACKVNNSPHAQLDSTSGLISASVRRTRLCQGVVLVNGILDVLPSVVASAGGGDLSSISSLTTNIQAFKSALVTADPSIGTVATVLSQYNCENDTSITDATIESYFAIIFEALIQ
jgi:hypothetical protein